MKVRLTERELEILRLSALGYTQEEIGKRLILAPQTIRNATLIINQKLGISASVQSQPCIRARSMLQAHALGLIDLDQLAREFAEAA